MINRIYSLKRSLYGILLATLSCIPFEERRFEVYNIETEAPRIIRYPSEAQLHINTDPAFHYIINKSKTEGEQDLVDLIQTATVEESWLFNKVNSDWIETGISEQPDEVSRDRRLIKNLDLNICIRYHIHPMQVCIKEEISYHHNKEQKILLNLANKKIDEITKENLVEHLMLNRDKKLELQAKLIEASAFPSLTDLIGCNKAASAVASEYGVVEFKSLTTTTYRDISDIDSYINNLTRYSENLFAKIYSEIRSNSDESLQIKVGYTSEDTIKAAVIHLNERFKGLLKFEFRPFTPRRILPLPSVPPLTSSRSRA